MAEKNKLQTIKEIWQEYYKMVLVPINPHLIQVVEMRRAFYSGAFAVISEMMKTADYEDEVGMAWLDAATKECAEFFTLVSPKHLKGDIGNG